MCVHIEMHGISTQLERIVFNLKRRIKWIRYGAHSCMGNFGVSALNGYGQ